MCYKRMIINANATYKNHNPRKCTTKERQSKNKITSQIMNRGNKYNIPDMAPALITISMLQFCWKFRTQQPWVCIHLYPAQEMSQPRTEPCVSCQKLATQRWLLGIVCPLTFKRCRLAQVGCVMRLGWRMYWECVMVSF